MYAFPSLGQGDRGKEGPAARRRCRLTCVSGSPADRRPRPPGLLRGQAGAPGQLGPCRWRQAPASSAPCAWTRPLSVLGSPSAKREQAAPSSELRCSVHGRQYPQRPLSSSLGRVPGIRPQPTELFSTALTPESLQPNPASRRHRTRQRVRVESRPAGFETAACTP